MRGAKRIWCRGSEFPVHFVFWAWMALVRHGCLLHLFANNTMNIKAFHHPSHSAADNRERLTLLLMPDLSDAVDFIVLFPNTFDLGAWNGISFDTIRRQIRVSNNGGLRMKCPLSLILRINTCKASVRTGQRAGDCPAITERRHKKGRCFSEDFIRLAQVIGSRAPSP